MQNDIDPNELMEMVTDALDCIAFMTVAPERRIEHQSTNIYTNVSFAGEEVTGTVSVAVDSGFAKELAAGFLASDEDEVDEATESLEAVLELTNIVGGQVIGALGSESREILIGLPERVETCMTGDDPLVRLRSINGVLEVHVHCASPLASND